MRQDLTFLLSSWPFIKQIIPEPGWCMKNCQHTLQVGSNLLMWLIYHFYDSLRLLLPLIARGFPFSYKKKMDKMAMKIRKPQRRFLRGQNKNTNWEELWELV